MRERCGEKFKVVEMYVVNNKSAAGSFATTSKQASQPHCLVSEELT